MKKWILRSVIGLLVLVLLAVGVTWLCLDSIAKSGIQQGGTYALGVPTDVKDVQLSLVNGTLMIDKLNIGNPEGFATSHMLQTGRFDLQVKPSSVINSPVDVSQLMLDGLDVNIERNDKGNNISAVMSNVRSKFSSGDKKEDNSPGRKVRVEKLVIKNVVAHVRLIGTQELTIKLPEIELNNITNDSPDGVTVSTLIGRIVPAVMASIVEKGKGIIPADLSAVLNKDVASTAQAMGAQASQLLQQVGGDASAMVQKNLQNALKGSGDLGKQVGGLTTKAADDIGKNLGKGADDAGKNIGDALKGVLPAADKKPK